MARKTLTFALLALMALTAHAQRFDWVKSYSGTDRAGQVDNWIVGSVTDNDGNLYVLGQCAHDAQLNGISLVPINHPNRNCILIAKFTPNGDVAWHKEIASPGINQACGITMAGDTSLICMVNITLKGMLYYLDTLYSNAQTEIMPSDLLDTRSVTAFITLGLNGELQEDHFLQVAYIDSSDSLITTDMQTGNHADAKTVSPDIFSSCDFCVDNQGNIIVARRASDEVSIGGVQNYSIENGLLSGYQIWVDGHSRFNIYPTNTPTTGNIALVKFSPHFLDMSQVNYLFENESGSSYIEIRSMACDNNNNIYFVGTTSPSLTDSATRNVQGLPITFTTYNIGTVSFLAKCNQSLQPEYFKYLKKDDEPQHFTFLEFSSFAFGDTCESVFVSGSTDGMVLSNIVTSDGDSLDVCKKVFFMQLNTGTGQMLTYGKPPTTEEGFSQILCGHNSQMRHSIVAKNNRVIIPVQFNKSIAWNDTAILLEENQKGFGLYMWDYEGHPINFIHVETSPTTQHLFGSFVNLHDSILYFSGHFEYPVNASFGIDDVTCSGNSIAFIARYVDTAFLTPYTPIDTTHTDPIDTGSVRITVVGDEGAFVAYPNPFRQKVTIEVQGGEPLAETAWLTDLTGRREELRLTPIGSGQYSLDLTSRPQATYLLTLTTADGKQHTVRLLKQSDIFGE